MTQSKPQSFFQPAVHKSAFVDGDFDEYRYTLGRDWSADTKKKYALFVMLNPSTADAFTDDPTIRRCISFAKREGCNAIEVVNLFAYRTPKPAKLYEAAASGVDIVGYMNDIYIAERASSAAIIIAGWGGAKTFDRVPTVMQILANKEVFCLGTTKAGAPLHPLYLPDSKPLERYHA